jgi:hypothetical protein
MTMKQCVVILAILLIGALAFAIATGEWIPFPAVFTSGGTVFLPGKDWAIAEEKASRKNPASQPSQQAGTKAGEHSPDSGFLWKDRARSA